MKAITGMALTLTIASGLLVGCATAPTSRYSDLSQASVGLQAGGQTFSELLVFESKDALDRFKAGQFNFAADASAVVLESGVATNAHFIDGVAVVVRPAGGAMVEASFGGQKLTYQAL
jgi:lipid-binding SYLF domain-containing protein